MHQTQNASAAEMRTPGMGEAETTFAASLGSRDQTETDTTNRTQGLAFEQAPRSYAKRLLDVTAKLALQGFSLYSLHDDKLLVTRWNMSRTLLSIEAAECFHRQVGGAR